MFSFAARAGAAMQQADGSPAGSAEPQMSASWAAAAAECRAEHSALPAGSAAHQAGAGMPSSSPADTAGEVPVLADGQIMIVPVPSAAISSPKIVFVVTGLNDPAI